MARDLGMAVLYIALLIGPSYSCDVRSVQGSGERVTGLRSSSTSSRFGMP